MSSCRCVVQNRAVTRVGAAAAAAAAAAENSSLYLITARYWLTETG